MDDLKTDFESFLQSLSKKLDTKNFDKTKLANEFLGSYDSIYEDDFLQLEESNVVSEINSLNDNKIADFEKRDVFRRLFNLEKLSKLIAQFPYTRNDSKTILTLLLSNQVERAAQEAFKLIKSNHHDAAIKEFDSLGGYSIYEKYFQDLVVLLMIRDIGSSNNFISDVKKRADAIFKADHPDTPLDYDPYLGQFFDMYTSRAFVQLAKDSSSLPQFCKDADNLLKLINACNESASIVFRKFKKHYYLIAGIPLQESRVNYSDEHSMISIDGHGTKFSSFWYEFLKKLIEKSLKSKEDTFFKLGDITTDQNKEMRDLYRGNSDREEFYNTYIKRNGNKYRFDIP